MSELREKVARAIYEANRDGSPVPWDDRFKHNYPAAARAHYKTADAILLVARPAIIEECAKVAEECASNPNLTRFQVGAIQYAVTAIRALAEKP